MFCSFTYIKRTLLHKRSESTAVGIFTNRLYLYSAVIVVISRYYQRLRITEWYRLHFTVEATC